MKRKLFSILALLLMAVTGAQADTEARGGTTTISSDRTDDYIYLYDGTLIINQGVTFTCNNAYFKIGGDFSTVELHGTLTGNVSSSNWTSGVINVYLSDGAKYTVTGQNPPNESDLRYYGYDAATDGNGTVSVKNGTTDVTSESTGSYTTTYTFTATPASGYKFKNWTKGAGGEVLGTDASINVTCEQNGTYQVYANFEQAAAPATPVPLTWDATAKTATLTNGMPAGNVTVSVEYFPQAEFAMSTDATPVALAPAPIPNVPANTDDPIVTAGTVANIGTTDEKQGTLMYFVSQSTGNTVPDAPDYDTKGWSDKVPTANGLKQGDVYVWYYIKGAEPANIADRTDDNTRSDSDIKPLGTTGFVTLLPEPTYDVTLNDEGLSTDEAAAWKVAKGTDQPAAFPLEGVKKGETVTVTYTGSKKVIGVKAEKKKAAEGHALTSAKLGEIVCSDGKAYAAADKDNLPKGVKAEALVCYVDGEHGLALAMADVKNEKMSWDNDRGANDGMTAAEWCTGWNTSHPIAGATWLLASKTQWDNMINAAGSASNLSNAFSAVGGTNLQAWSYWSSTPNHGGSAAWFYYFPSSAWQWTYLNQDSGRYIRACLEW